MCLAVNRTVPLIICYNSAKYYTKFLSKKQILLIDGFVDFFEKAFVMSSSHLNESETSTFEKD